jgi:hypothetical protein
LRLELFSSVKFDTLSRALQKRKIRTWLLKKHRNGRACGRARPAVWIILEERFVKNSAKNLIPSLVALVALSLTSVNATSVRADDASAGDPNSDANYDRLDGVGKSGKTVQVIEWEDNLEIHVYPPGSLKGLALKIDHPSKDKKVMVIGYRFSDNPKEQLIRRAILGISLTEGFKTYKDPTETEFDKIIISNNGLSGQVVGFALDPAPKQLYPDGHPALTNQTDVAKTATPGGRSPASVGTSGQKTHSKSVDGGTASAPPDTDGNGGIRPFFK